MRKAPLFLLLLLCFPLFSENSTLALPSLEPGAQIIVHREYTLQYNEETEQADWVAYSLTGEMLKGLARRKNSFKTDPLVFTGSAHPSDYKGSGYDRGHLAPAADMKLSPLTMAESFYMSNMSPQSPGLNRGIWKKLEEKVREWGGGSTEMLIICGPLWSSPPVEFLGINRVAVPPAYFKALLKREASGKYSGVAFVFNNSSSGAELFEHAMSIDELELLLDRNLFPALPDEWEGPVEQNWNLLDWVNPEETPSEIS